MARVSWEIDCPVEAEVTELYAELQAPLLRYTLALGLPVADGEDVVQETFLSLFHHPRKGKPKDNLRGWAFRVVHNLALKRRRRNARSAETSGSDFESVDPALNPEEQAVCRSRQMRLLAVLRALPERDRWCLWLRAEGLRYRDIAETLGVSLGSVAASLSRALKRLGDVGPA